jgi:hypothetical protein
VNIKLQAKTLRVRKHLGDLSVNGRILRGQSESMGTRFIRIETESSSSYQPLGSAKGGEFYD